MNVKLIRSAIREMDREVDRRYGRDEDPGEVQTGGYYNTGRDRRRARDQEEEPRMTVQRAHEHMKDRHDQLREMLDPQDREEFSSHYESAGLGEDEPLEFRGRPSPGGRLDSGNPGRENIMPNLGGELDRSQLSTVISPRDDLGEIQIAGDQDRRHRRGAADRMALDSKAMDEAFAPSVARIRVLDSYGKQPHAKARQPSGRAMAEIAALIPGISKIRSV